MYKMSCKYTCCAFSLMLLVCVFSVSSKNVDNSERTSEEDSCGKVKSFLATRNITVVAAKGADDKGPTCAGRCCSAETEVLLRAAGRRDLEALLRHHARSLHGLLVTTEHTLHDHVVELAQQSENKTLYLFGQVYQRLAVLSMGPISKLYTDITNYIKNTSDYSSSSELNIEASVSDFFTDLFPLVYHHAVNLQVYDFSEDYKTCLRHTMKEIQPFGDIPRQISQQIFKSLEATRVLLRALSLGSEVLNTTDVLLTEEAEKSDSSQSACHTALLKMSYCAKCTGLDTHIKPCSGYCLNVLRGCLTQHVSELDLPWNGYVAAVERLVLAMRSHDTGAGINVDSVIKGLDTRISEAIMHAMENGPSLEKKVKRACGHAKLSSEEPPKEDDDTQAAGRRQQRPRPQRPARIGSGMWTTPVDSHMLFFLYTVTGSRGFFLNFADTLCRDESFAEQRDGAECWNGERVGEYTKTVVGTSVSFQKYNPEYVNPAMTSSQEAPTTDTRVAKLSDQLRHMTQMILSQLSTSYPASESYMQGDEAGSVDGSGSGRSDNSFSDDDEIDEGSQWTEGSGSGNGDIIPDPKNGSNANNTSVEYPKSSSAVPKAAAVSSVFLSMASLFILRYCV